MYPDDKKSPSLCRGRVFLKFETAFLRQSLPSPERSGSDPDLLPSWPVSLGLDSVLSGQKNSAMTLIKWRASQKEAGQDLWFLLFPGKPGC